MEHLRRDVQNQDWSELINNNEGAMTAPTDLSVATYRIWNNGKRFRAQYTIVMAGMVAVYLVMNHFMLSILLALLAGAWHHVLQLQPGQQVQLIGRAFIRAESLTWLCPIIIAVIVLNNLLAVFGAVVVAVLVVCVHGAILDPGAAPNRRP
ncbi:PRA1 family protein B5-like [Arachis hypogaea]|uniref:PRA1 family protein B5-like n=1 Tax=Arachis hypogaea TaxID=3818 RepID=UPI003B21C454